MSVRDEIQAKLTGPGGPFEIAQEEVLGERMAVLQDRPRSLRELLAAAAPRGTDEYIVHGETRISYGELVPRVASVARALSLRHGIHKGDRVAILAANCAEWVIAFWATVSLGGIVAALNSLWTADEVAFGVADAEPSLLIGDRKRLARIAGLGLAVPSVEIESGFAALLGEGAEGVLPDVPIAEDDPAVILYTSGTTGRPKGALASHRGIIGFVQTTLLSGAITAMQDASTSRAAAPPAVPGGPPCSLVTAPLFHLSGLYAMVVLQLAIGGKLVFRSGRFDPEEVLRLIEQERVSAWGALGSTGPRVAAVKDLDRFDRSSMANVGFGGAPVSPATQQKMREVFPNAKNSLGIGYGSSESVAVPASIRGAEYARHPDSTGWVTPTHEVEIRDAEGRVLPEGQEGEIHIRSPYLMLGYWRNPEATRETLLPGRWLATGDIGHLENGLLYINSRARDMILRNAENIYPAEIENRLDSHPAVRESAVVGVDHPEWGQEVKAIVVPEQGRKVDPADLEAWCRETLAAYKVPTTWALRGEPLPRNPSGKVLKNVLQGAVKSRFVEE